MLFLHDYIEQFRQAGTAPRRKLASLLAETKSSFDIFSDGDPESAFESFVKRYNWLGLHKAEYGISQNESRNLVGALLQDYLLHFVIRLCKPHPSLDVFTEVPVSFGRYPLWRMGQVQFASPSERSDLAVGYVIDETGAVRPGNSPWPRQPYYRLPGGQSLFPLVTVNSKIRVSQGEFFDWLGREQLMTKGNPHCFSVQVALRKEMDMSIVQAAQAGDKFFLLGEGGEQNVVPNRKELVRFSKTVAAHLKEHMQGEI